MRTLIHICCGPCLGGPLEALRLEGFEVSGCFFNPNIHPLLEFRKRLKAVRVFQETDPLHIVIEDEYGLERFLREVEPLNPERCERCVALRLGHTARLAAKLGAPSFTTTLLVSRHQKHEAVRLAGERAAQEAGVKFLYRDFRPLADRSHEIARQRRLYRQSYCGCVFSEAERYRDTTREVYRGPGGAPRQGQTEGP